jgi:hypothetical protein
MYRRLMTIGVLAIVVAAIAATPASASRSCGSTHLLASPVETVQVTIARGPLSCAQARTVAREWGSSRGVVHRVSAAYTLWYTTYPGGWETGTQMLTQTAVWLHHELRLVPRNAVGCTAE